MNLALDAGGAEPDPTLLGPAAGVPLRPNPLYVDGVRRWPHERWAAEYGPRAATYLPERWDGGVHHAAGGGNHAVRTRLLLDLPGAW